MKLKKYIEDKQIKFTPAGYLSYKDGDNRTERFSFNILVDSYDQLEDLAYELNIPPTVVANLIIKKYFDEN